jgi:hypothetical protein
MSDEPVADDTNPLVLTFKFWVPSACVDDGALGGIGAGMSGFTGVLCAPGASTGISHWPWRDLLPYSTDILQLNLCLGQLRLTC